MKYLKPLQRPIKRGTKGQDVRATKYALKHAGFKRGIVISGKAGLAWERNLKRFQAKHGLKPDGEYGPATHRALRPHLAAVPYAAWLWNHYVHKDAAVSPRRAIVNAALYGVAHAASIHYTQSSRRMEGCRLRLKPPAYPRNEDCSSFATWCYFVAGAPDPNGRGYDGQGYTGTLAAHGRRVRTPAALRPGDLVFYGGGFPYGHVAVYIGGGKVVSHGSEAGPLVCNVNYRPISTMRSYLP